MISTKSILLVDDDNDLREALAEQFDLHDGFEARQATSGAEALRIASETRLDLILLDINMPRMDGFGLIESVRSTGTHAEVPILVLTTESGADLKARARSAGATGWIVKPFEDARLIAVIDKVLGR